MRRAHCGLEALTQALRVCLRAGFTNKRIKTKCFKLFSPASDAGQRLEPSLTADLAANAERQPMDVHRGAAARRTRFMIALPRPTSGTGSTKICWTFSWSISLSRLNNRWAAIRKSLVSLKDRTAEKFAV